MKKEGTSILANMMIWFGAGISIAEIITGTYIAPLGFKKGVLAILLGHLIGGLVMFLAGLISARLNKSAMESVKISYGENGGKFFSILNVIQLVGWTAIMIYDGAMSANEIFANGTWFWALMIGILIVLWIKVGIKNLGKINFVAMGGLFILTIILSKIIFINSSVSQYVPAEMISFGFAVELSAAMPLSWLPVIGDYTKDSENSVLGTFVSVVSYNVISIWMFLIGMGSAIFTGESDIANIFLKAGLGIIGLLVVVFSTVTTTFLDAFSSGVSAKSIFKNLDEKYTGIAVAIIGTILAIIFPMDNITDFLFFIGSVFDPMIAIVFVDFYIFNNDYSNTQISKLNFLIWIVGFLVYRYLLNFETVLGNTFPDILITMIIAFVVKKLASYFLVTKR